LKYLKFYLQVLEPLIEFLENADIAVTGHLTIPELLNQQNMQGETSLHLAIGEENYNACKMLICKGADVNLSKNKGVTPLHLASVKDSLVIVQLLVSAGARVTATDESQEIPLHKAARNNKERIVKYLLEV